MRGVGLQIVYLVAQTPILELIIQDEEEFLSYVELERERKVLYCHTQQDIRETQWRVGEFLEDFTWVFHACLTLIYIDLDGKIHYPNKEKS